MDQRHNTRDTRDRIRLARGGGGRANVLVVALDAQAQAEVANADVLVVAPALNSRLRHWLSDEDDARRRAQERAAALVERLERCGVRAEGRVGDADPLQAIADALRTFPADAIVIASRPEHSTRLVDALVSAARERFALPTSRAGSFAEAATADRAAA
jgi:nucleotide-binding universal stress UspA family protein